MAANTFTYGGVTIDAIAVLNPKVTSNFDNFSVTCDLKLSKDTYINLLAAMTTAEGELRKENLKTVIEINGVTWWDLDPADNTAMIVRPSFVVNRVGKLDADISVTINGKLPARIADGNYPLAWSCQISQTERKTCNITGVYTATGAETAFENYLDAGTGGEAKATAILAAFFPGVLWDLLASSFSEPEDSDKWMEFSLTYSERLLPNLHTWYDYTNIQWTQNRTPIGQRVFDAKGDEWGNSLSGGMVSPSEASIRYSLSGNIPLKSSIVNYDDAMEVWENVIKIDLFDLISTYFLAKAQNPGNYSNAFFENITVNFNATDNVLDIGGSIVVPESGGIIAFHESVTYIPSPGIVSEDYVNGKDDYDAWTGKMPSGYHCQQQCTYESIFATLDRPPAPAMPGGVSDVVWIVEGDPHMTINKKRYLLASRSNVRVNTFSVSYSCMWKLIKRPDYEPQEKPVEDPGRNAKS